MSTQLLLICIQCNNIFTGRYREFSTSLYCLPPGLPPLPGPGKFVYETLTTHILLRVEHRRLQLNQQLSELLVDKSDIVWSLYLVTEIRSELFHRACHCEVSKFSTDHRQECLGAVIVKNTQYPVQLLLSQFTYNLLTTFTAKIHRRMFDYLPKSREIRLKISPADSFMAAAILTQAERNNQWLCSFQTKALSPY